MILKTKKISSSLFHFSKLEVFKKEDKKGRQKASKSRKSRDEKENTVSIST